MRGVWASVLAVVAAIGCGGSGDGDGEANGGDGSCVALPERTTAVYTRTSGTCPAETFEEEYTRADLSGEQNDPGCMSTLSGCTITHVCDTAGGGKVTARFDRSRSPITGTAEFSLPADEAGPACSARYTIALR